MDWLAKPAFTRERRLERSREDIAKRLIYRSNFLESSYIILLYFYNLDFFIILVVIA